MNRIGQSCFDDAKALKGKCVNYLWGPLCVVRGVWRRLSADCCAARFSAVGAAAVDGARIAGALLVVVVRILVGPYDCCRGPAGAWQAFCGCCCTLTDVRQVPCGWRLGAVAAHQLAPGWYLVAVAAR